MAEVGIGETSDLIKREDFDYLTGNAISEGALYPVPRLLDRDSGELKLVASYGLSNEFLNKGPVSATTSATQALKGETLVIDDATTDDRIQYKKEMKKEGIGSMIVTPIKSRDEVIGVLRLYASVKREFPEDFITVVQALAHQGALAIQNATMYLELQKDKEELEHDIWSHRSWF